jgi:hypothetical protein
MNHNHPELAKRFREITGTTGLERTLSKAVEVLYKSNIPHFVIGGYAVQEHGYRRYTDNVDLLVPDVPRAYECLCRNGFTPHPTSKTTVVDPEHGYEVRLHQGGRSIEA